MVLLLVGLAAHSQACTTLLSSDAGFMFGIAHLAHWSAQGHRLWVATAPQQPICLVGCLGLGLTSESYCCQPQLQ